MGPETLSEIRTQLRKHLSKDDQDPIARIDQLIRERGDNKPAGNIDVLQSLKRLLETTPMRKPKKKPKKRITAKKK
jgi:hypothetical protein